MGRCPYTNGIFVMTEDTDLSKQGLLLVVGDYPVRPIVLYEKEFCSMVFWELNPKCWNFFG
jgi:hypothetical protein